MRASFRGWVRAFLLASLFTSMIGVLLAAIGLSPPEFSGLPALALATVVIRRLQLRPTPGAVGAEGGWGGAAGSWLRSWLPSGLGPNALTGIRKVFLGFAVALVVFGGVIVAIDSNDGIGSSLVSPTAGLLAVVVLGIAAIAGVRLVAQSLDCTDQARLVGSYQTRFFVRLAISETPALGGFVAVFLSGEASIYWLGCAFAALNFWHLAPSDRNLARDQERLVASGCPLSLVDALRDTHPPRP